MKKIKVSLAMVALFLGVIAASAFNTHHSVKAFQSQWFTYNGTGDPTQSANYTAAGTTEPSCAGTTVVCAIFAGTNGSDKPIIDATLKDDINQALSQQSNLPDVDLR